MQMELGWKLIVTANDLTISGAGAEVFANNISITLILDIDTGGTEQLKGSGTLVLGLDKIVQQLV